MQHEIMDCDILIVGAGPAGLSAAIQIATRAQKDSQSLSILLIEKGASVGAHILSGAAIDSRSLNELIPDWKTKNAPLNTPVTEDRILWLTKHMAFKMPLPKMVRNHGNYIISLGRFCEWLGVEAESLGVQIMPGFAAQETWIQNGILQGVITGAFGIDKDGNQTANYQPPIGIRAKYTLFAEGCRGSISEQLMRDFQLRDECQHQTYGIGIKELWQVPKGRTSPGTVEHTVGWPLDSKTYGGSFIYHADETTVSLGMVIGLDYENPYLDPFKEMQRFKTHPHITKLLQGGKRLSYGARALNEGGLQSLPKLVFPGGALIGDAAGFLNVPKIKGTHTSMKSGMLAADAAYEALRENRAHDMLTSYPESFRKSWLYNELRAARNIRPAFKFGRMLGMFYSGFDMIFAGKVPWTLKHHTPDHLATKPADSFAPIIYPQPDNVLTFDRLSSIFISNTNHIENQPCHLTLKDATLPVTLNLPEYAGPEQRYCPAGVYEFIEKDGAPTLQINAQNCVHCKTCDIKDMSQNIKWVPPEGSGGPNYSGM